MTEPKRKAKAKRPRSDRPKSLRFRTWARRAAENLSKDRNSLYPHSGRKQVCILPWTEYDQNHSPEYLRPKELYKDRRELEEMYAESHQFELCCYHIISQKCLDLIEKETHILGYFLEVY